MTPRARIPHPLLPPSAPSRPHALPGLISVRQLDHAVDALGMAEAELAASAAAGGPWDLAEPDGAPNAANLPTSTLGSNIACEYTGAEAPTCSLYGRACV